MALSKCDGFSDDDAFARAGNYDARLGSGRGKPAEPDQTALTLPLVEKPKMAAARSLLGQAIDYALGQWVPLLPYVDDGRGEIENNLVENAIRPTALGKKN